ncbi:GNAT family N-acetyltransferase [Streptomyces sp. TP-A0874]|uniref:GNAT family N-acetyltransferase n=1 Tax=Streptomyces sp. TP-A0874 TaxID=549819 RepID=UPI000853159C|nr:GNAT family N-acetyltransferase [Streptomyces sp. TP-A0874]
MAITYQLNPPVGERLRQEICSLWADVTNAGGAVGFVPPVTAETVRPALLRQLAAMTTGDSQLLVGTEEDGSVVATAFLVPNSSPLMRHWWSVYTVMVHPSQQGQGTGRQLMAAVAAEARHQGLRAVRLTCRGGLGLEDFYAACGYKEVGRVPGAIKVAEDDYRDDITMWLPLH